jgi:hypothetical protein
MSQAISDVHSAATGEFTTYTDSLLGMVMKISPLVVCRSSC